MLADRSPRFVLLHLGLGSQLAQSRRHVEFVVGQTCLDGVEAAGVVVGLLAQADDGAVLADRGGLDDLVVVRQNGVVVLELGDLPADGPNLGRGLDLLADVRPEFFLDVVVGLDQDQALLRRHLAAITRTQVAVALGHEVDEAVPVVDVEGGVDLGGCPGPALVDRQRRQRLVPGLLELGHALGFELVGSGLGRQLGLFEDDRGGVLVVGDLGVRVAGGHELQDLLLLAVGQLAVGDVGDGDGGGGDAREEDDGGQDGQDDGDQSAVHVGLLLFGLLLSPWSTDG
ncbi:hypothetical protein C4566_00440 [Candidatus Parcubacteria bacterium]|nr:MAG: hypothetical protein C4566_00440 [Candidatus Parcubacteria bacterium]